MRLELISRIVAKSNTKLCQVMDITGIGNKFTLSLQHVPEAAFSCSSPSDSTGDDEQAKL
jgi:hypothetical protein